MKEKNKMAVVPMKRLFWSMGLPMIISMVLQALYNVVDSIFVTNMGEYGAISNLALTYAFPIPILIIAIGVGTGVKCDRFNIRTFMLFYSKKYRYLSIIKCKL